MPAPKKKQTNKHNNNNKKQTNQKTHNLFFSPYPRKSVSVSTVRNRFRFCVTLLWNLSFLELIPCPEKQMLITASRYLINIYTSVY